MVPSQAKGWHIETLASAKPVETHRADGAVSVLLAHIVSTSSLSETVTDSDMGYPTDWRTRAGKSTDVGHQESGRTIALHSLAVAPKLQGCGVGKIILKAYIQQMNNSGLADRVSLLCQDVCLLLFSSAGRSLTSYRSTWSRTTSASVFRKKGPARRSSEEAVGTTW